ncbi:hypothetical protein ACRAWF_40535 [Streptomyces sp. L7]
MTARPARTERPGLRAHRAHSPSTTACRAPATVTRDTGDTQQIRGVRHPMNSTAPSTTPTGDTRAATLGGSRLRHRLTAFGMEADAAVALVRPHVPKAREGIGSPGEQHRGAVAVADVRRAHAGDQDSAAGIDEQMAPDAADLLDNAPCVVVGTWWRPHVLLRSMGRAGDRTSGRRSPTTSD